MKPILMNGEMVRAMLNDLKTQTRRLVTPQPVGTPSTCRWYEPTVIRKDGEEEPGRPVFGFYDEEEGWKCPYGAPGDVLYVRETWNTFEAFEGIFYRADDHCLGIGEVDDPDHVEPHDVKWRSSTHMPKWASRIKLKIKAVRVERLQDISEADARAEGVETREIDTCGVTPWGASIIEGTSHRGEFAVLWDSINTKPGTTWAENPWVWPIEFERIRKEEMSLAV